MTIPGNYMEWCSLFDQIAADARNEDYIQIVRRGTISWQSGVAERFVQAVSTMIRKRVNNAQDKFQRQMKNAGGSTNNLISALNALNKEFKYVYDLANALPIPDDYRVKIAQSVVDQANQAQKSLEDSAKADRSGRMSATVRSSKVNRFT